MQRLHGNYVSVLLVVITAWGAFLRFWRLGDRPFWSDEAWVAIAVRDLPYGTLFRQTDLPMPPLFAVATKLVGNLVGPPEFGYRLLPALCGVLLLPLAYLAVRELRLPRTVGLAGTGLCASGMMLVIWSRNLKQYSLEAFFSVLMAWLTFRLSRGRSHTDWWIHTVALVVVCAVGPWFGYGAVFPLVVLSAMLTVLKPIHGSRRACIAAGGAGLLALAASVMLLWLLAGQAQASDPSLLGATRNRFVETLSLRSWGRIAFYGATSSVRLLFPADWFASAGALRTALWVGTSAVMVWMLALLGLRTWPRRSRRQMAVWVLGPWLALLGAAVLHRYPFGAARLMQFWAAPMSLVLATGLIGLWRNLGLATVGRGGPALVSGILLGVLPAAYVIREPMDFRYHVLHDFPKLLKVLERDRRAGELVLVDLNAVPPVRYYRPDLPPPVVYTPVTAGVCRVVGQDQMTLVRDTARRAGRRWWMLAVSPASYSHYQRMLTVVKQEGYSVRLVERGGVEGAFCGVAHLLVATRR